MFWDWFNKHVQWFYKIVCQHIDKTWLFIVFGGRPWQFFVLFFKFFQQTYWKHFPGVFLIFLGKRFSTVSILSRIKNYPCMNSLCIYILKLSNTGSMTEVLLSKCFRFNIYASNMCNLNNLVTWSITNDMLVLLT